MAAHPFPGSLTELVIQPALVALAFAGASVSVARHIARPAGDLPGHVLFPSLRRRLLPASGEHQVDDLGVFGNGKYGFARRLMQHQVTKHPMAQAVSAQFRFDPDGAEFQELSAIGRPKGDESRYALSINNAAGESLPIQLGKILGRIAIAENHRLLLQTGSQFLPLAGADGGDRLFIVTITASHCKAHGSFLLSVDGAVSSLENKKTALSKLSLSSKSRRDKL